MPQVYINDNMNTSIRKSLRDTWSGYKTTLCSVLTFWCETLNILTISWFRVFPTLFRHGGGGDLSTPYEGTSAGEQTVNGGTHEGGHRPCGGT